MAEASWQRKLHGEAEENTKIKVKPDFVAATLPGHLCFWQTLTTDNYVLNIVKGYNIELDTELWHSRELLDLSHQSFHSRENSVLIYQEIRNLESMGVIEQCESTVEQYISPVFLVKKHDNSFRKILNLKSFNRYVKYEHFKMESLKHLTDIVSQGCFMTSVDLRKAYYSVSVHPTSRKYLRFVWNKQLYQYCGLPNGLSSAPRIFTRLMKVIFSTLRDEGCDCVFYIDDSIFVANTYDKCLADTSKAVNMLERAGFCIHAEKSVMNPCHKIRFLGFIVDSLDMKVYLPAEKQDKIKVTVSELLECPNVTIERLAQVIGLLVSCMPAYVFGKLHYRGLELDKINGLKTGNYRTKIELTHYAKEDLSWWLHNVHKSGFPIKPIIYEVEVYTDASLAGYGASTNGVTVGSRWSENELSAYGDNINTLEMLAVKHAIASFSNVLKNRNVCIRTDNTTTVSYINLMGGTHSTQCNSIAHEIWQLAIKHDIMLHASFIPGHLNVDADYASRHFNEDIEISLNQDVFGDICNALELSPLVDLFASRHNYKVEQFVSWKPDPLATYVDAFTINWATFDAIYVFPPFSCWGKVLKWLRIYKGQALVIFPDWRSQFWYPGLIKLCQTTVRLKPGSVTLPSRLASTVWVAGRII